MHFGPNIVGAVAGVAVWAPLVLFWEPPFLAIRDLSYVDGAVVLEAAVRKPNTFADRSVAVFDGVTGKNLCNGGGRTEYATTDPSRKVYPADVFIGQEGCIDSLSVGRSIAYVVWRPLDGREPVHETFIIEKLNHD